MGFIDPNDFEKVALSTASEMGGAYLVSENLHLVPVAEFTPHQWNTLVGVICANYVSSLIDQQEQAQIALRKVQTLPPPGGTVFPSFNLTNDLPE